MKKYLLYPDSHRYGRNKDFGKPLRQSTLALCGKKDHFFEENEVRDVKCRRGCAPV
jgi:hypothetical protein